MTAPTTLSPLSGAGLIERPPRTGAARALAILGVVAVTLWWLTWVGSRSILSEARSDAIGAALVEDPTVQDDVARQVREAMVSSGAMSLGFTEADLDVASTAVAADAAVAPDVAERVADAHRRALLAPDNPDAWFGTVYDDQPFVDASLRALGQQRPDITIPDLRWAFSTTVSDGFPDLTGPAAFVARWRTPLLLLAVFGFVGSAVVFPDRRPRRWLARWCLVTGAITLAIPIVGPPVADQLAGSAASVLDAVSASLDGGAPRRGAIILVALGTLLSLGTWARQARTARGSALDGIDLGRPDLDGRGPSAAPESVAPGRVPLNSPS